MAPMTTARRLALLPLLLLVPGAAVSAPLARREVLPNGIVLLVAERPAVPIVAVRAYFRAGSAFDPPDAPGLANLTARLLTRGTATRTGADIDRAIEFVGGSLESDASRDGITVSLSVLKKDLPLGLDLLADVVRRPSFPEPELARTRKQIQAGIQRSEENPEAVAGRGLMRLVYLGHPYGHPADGTRESVGGLTREQVVRYYASTSAPTPRSSRSSAPSLSTRRGGRCSPAAATGRGRRRRPRPSRPGPRRRRPRRRRSRAP